MSIHQKQDETTILLLERPDSKPSKNFKQNSQVKEIQGLRGIAIIGVLLFHLRPDLFPIGYLGVDIFFAISGYLMCSILTRKLPLSFTKIADFYYQRIKRIVPIYLFSIFLTLAAAIFLFLHPMDYETLYKETLKPLIFCANVPDKTDLDYFAQSVQEFKYFTHLWSLSVEIQFYLLVPLLMVILYLSPNYLKFTILSIITCLSYLYQDNANGNQKHMILLSRIWQFLVGFIAYEIQQIDYNKFNHKILTIFMFIMKSILPYVLILTLFVQILPNPQQHRLLVMVLTLLILAFPNNQLVLCYWPLIELGNISYSVYLLHWPLFQWYSYSGHVLMFESYNFYVMFLLIFTSILMGYIMENGYKMLAKHINSWTTLFNLLIVLYLLVYANVHYLQSYRFNTSNVFILFFKALFKNTHS